VNDYTACFMELSCRDESLTEHQQIQLYIAGLGDPLCTNVQLQQPTKLDDAVIFARAYEERNAARTAAPQPARGGDRFSTRVATPGAPTAPQGPPAPAFPGGNKQQAITLCLSPAEIAQRRKENKCFHCDEAFASGHKQHCKQLFVIEVVAETIEEDEPLEPDEPTISLHALTEVQPRAGRTMQLRVAINGAHFLALLDSGSTHNFLDTEAAARAGVDLHGRTGLRVAVANSDHVTSLGCCRGLKIGIEGEPFVIDCYGLTLGSFDMVLGVQWLATLGPILWDFSRRTMALVHNGQRLVWNAADTSALTPSLHTVTGDLPEELLAHFAEVFTEPTGLPPQREHNHRIHLLPGSAPVAVHPYRYTHV
jgi:hypothetical protein